MGRRQIGLKLAMDGLGVPMEMGTFDGRLIVQKAAYLAQAAGVHLGYWYRWYLRGPYCPAVADDAFSLSLEGEEATSGWSLDPQSTERLQGLRGLLDIPDPAARARKLELLASVHFLIDRKQVAGRSPEKIVALLRKYEKDFDQNDVSQALGELKEHGLLS